MTVACSTIAPRKTALTTAAVSGMADDADHAAGHVLASPPRGDDEEHREDAAEQRNGEDADERDRSGEPVLVGEEQKLEDEERERGRRNPGEVAGPRASRAADRSRPRLPGAGGRYSTTWL